MIVLPFLAGAVVLVAAVVLRQLWLASPPRSVCPACGGATMSVRHALSARTDGWVRRRWCAGCGWSGWGRNGPVLMPERGPVAHDSGFRWGEERMEPDFGFRWRGDRAPAPAPDHPSGFRWRG